MRAPATTPCLPCRRAAVRGAPGRPRWSYPGRPRRRASILADTTRPRGGLAGPGAGTVQLERCRPPCNLRGAALEQDRLGLPMPARSPHPPAVLAVLVSSASVGEATRARRSRGARGLLWEAVLWPILRPG